MRLLNVKNCQFTEYYEPHIPPYAIVSHTWNKDEASYAGFPEDKRTSGYQKILGVCSVASILGLEWLWIDTCCVDRRSGAEISESINSTFRWYQHAKICLAHLSDVPPWSEGHNKVKSAFLISRWFRRGWTLHELLAPQFIMFLNADFEFIGCKNGSDAYEYWRNFDSKYGLPDLTTDIAKLTGIPIPYLQGEDLATASEEEKFGWIRWRRTTRVEDMAYCLVGIFGLNMPVNYGEGPKAFERLKLEIRRQRPYLTTGGKLDTPSLLRNRKRGLDLDYDVDSRSPSIDPWVLTAEGDIEFRIKQSTPQPATSSVHLKRPPSPDAVGEVTQALSLPFVVEPERIEIASLLPFCWVLIIVGVLIVTVSFAMGLYFTIAKDRMGDGFTLAGWIIAVGTLALGIPITQHYPQCKCWTKKTDGVLGSA